MKPTLKQRAALRRNKYGNKPTYVDGIRFASKAEATRYQELKLLERAGQIADLQRQPRFTVAHDPKNQRIVNYVGDFLYSENGRVVVEDVKGKETEAFKVKRVLMGEKYPSIDFRIVKVRA